ncbi:MAG: hypothetical protein EKK37_15240 [Sphingobacteriales bacterium]|nr:MAG: hypothetical protein EKK37_15240 [Sphingobacteriales bacterium]
MRHIYKYTSPACNKMVLLVIATILAMGNTLIAQDTTATSATEDTSASTVVKKKYVKSTFEGNYLIDEQTVMVPIKGTLEFGIHHRFGPTNNGFTDLFGIFGGANMRLGFAYVPISNLQVGFGANNNNMVVDFNAKYALLKQTKDNRMPVSVTLYANAAMDTRKRTSSLPIVTFSDRLTFFNQLLIARKITNAFSVQAGINLTHFNNVEGYYDDNKNILPKLKNDHLSFCIGGRYKISEKTAIIVNYDQPLTQHPMNNPNPNLSIGLDMRTSGHDFQVFIGNYGYTLPQDNNLLNHNDFTKGQFVIGFNITRLYNF